MELYKVPRGGIAREHLHEVVPFLDGLDFPVESDVVSADLGMHFGYALEIAAEVCAAAFKIVADYELEALLRIFHVAGIIASVENSQNDRDTMFKTLDEVEAQLAVVYRDGYKGDIQFEMSLNSLGQDDLSSL